MERHKHHQDLVDVIAKQFANILNESKQAIYIYLDNNHKVCNNKFPTLLGYNSADQWAKNKSSLTNHLLKIKARKNWLPHTLKAMTNMVASKIKIYWKKKGGSVVDTDVILVPIACKDNLFALHFVTKIT